jgi:hypothetical protein
VTARRPEYTRPFSAEYLRASGHVVTRLMDGPMREYVDAAYVQWLELELAKAREK